MPPDAAERPKAPAPADAPAPVRRSDRPGTDPARAPAAGGEPPSEPAAEAPGPEGRRRQGLGRFLSGSGRASFAVPHGSPLDAGQGDALRGGPAATPAPATPPAGDAAEPDLFRPVVEPSVPVRSASTMPARTPGGGIGARPAAGRAPGAAPGPSPATPQSPMTPPAAPAAGGGRPAASSPAPSRSPSRLDPAPGPPVTSRPAAPTGPVTPAPVAPAAPAAHAGQAAPVARSAPASPARPAPSAPPPPAPAPARPESADPVVDPWTGAAPAGPPRGGKGRFGRSGRANADRHPGFTPATGVQAPGPSVRTGIEVQEWVRGLLDRRSELFGVGETAQVLADEVIERGEADAAAVLVPDGTRWRVSGGVGLRPLERRLLLDTSHWLISEIAVGGRALLIEDTDIVRPRLAGAPLAAWRHLLAVPVPGLRAAVVLARGQEAARFTDRDLTSVVPVVAEAADLLAAALRMRELARALAPLRDVDG